MLSLKAVIDARIVLSFLWTIFRSRTRALYAAFGLLERPGEWFWSAMELSMKEERETGGNKLFFSSASTMNVFRHSKAAQKASLKRLWEVSASIASYISGRSSRIQFNVISRASMSRFAASFRLVSATAKEYTRSISVMRISMHWASRQFTTMIISRVLTSWINRTQKFSSSNTQWFSRKAWSPSRDPASKASSVMNATVASLLRLMCEDPNSRRSLIHLEHLPDRRSWTVVYSWTLILRGHLVWLAIISLGVNPPAPGTNLEIRLKEENGEAEGNFLTQWGAKSGGCFWLLIHIPLAESNRPSLRPLGRFTWLSSTGNPTEA